MLTLCVCILFFFQLVWATSNRIGCAINVCYNMNVWGMIWAKAVYLVCNYSPPYVFISLSISSETAPSNQHVLTLKWQFSFVSMEASEGSFYVSKVPGSFAKLAITSAEHPVQFHTKPAIAHFFDYHNIWMLNYYLHASIWLASGTKSKMKQKDPKIMLRKFCCAITKILGNLGMILKVIGRTLSFKWTDQIWFCVTLAGHLHTVASTAVLNGIGQSGVKQCSVTRFHSLSLFFF